MFKNIYRPVVRSNTVFRNRCHFSVVSVHSTFPATLYRLQFRRESQLYDKQQQQEDSEVEDAVKISQDGLIYPEICDSSASAFPLHHRTLLTSLLVSNGALFMPNTFFMQELTRMSFDYYLDNLANSQPSADPHVLCIPKGWGFKALR